MIHRHKEMVRNPFLLFLLVSALAVAGCATQEKNPAENSSATVISEEVPPVVIQEFELGPGDIIEINVWRNDDLYRSIQIGPTGAITYPLVGTMDVGGLSVTELRDHIATGLSEYLVDPQVGISIVSYQSNKVFVLGEINRPGVFQSPTQISALEAIAMAGGFTLDAETKTTLLVRGNIDNPELITLNLSDALKKADVSQNVALMPGDVLYVPASAFASAERFFRRINSIIRPIVVAETGITLGPAVEDALHGDRVPTGVVISP